MNKWYFNRLMTMSVAEICFRIKQWFRGHLEEKFGYKFQSLTKDLVSKKNILEFNTENAKIHPNIFRVFGADFNYGNPQGINWQKDILSGEVFLQSFYRKINIRGNPKLSAKCVWEINRLQFLPNICMNYRITKNRSELDLFMQIIKSWSSQNPFLTGINWYSNIEINLRLITWFICWEILEAESLESDDISFKEFLENDWLPLIQKHCVYSFKNPSKYSSANNHLISEYAGLFIASSKWKFNESEKWGRYARTGLEEEIVRQHSKEGINREEAAEYIQFITDFFLLSYIVGEKTSKPFSEQFKQQLYKIFCYIYDFLDCNGNFPKYGDEDDGRCFILYFDEKFNNFKSLLTSGAIIFNNAVFKSKSNGFDIKNHLLFGEQGKKVYESIPLIRNSETSRFYREEGHFIFRKKENGKEIYLHFDAAPLGFLSIAAHGHADALSFILHVDGQPVFIDSGTYTYHTEPEWRSYFIGTLAHNTIRLNQKDQAVNGGPTLWIKHYETNTIESDLSDVIDRIKASHNGYFKEGARHIREIVFDKLRNEFQIHDTIAVGKTRKIQVEIPFHIHPEAAITKSSTNCYLVSKNHVRKIEFHVDERLDTVVVKGQMKPQILGWYSDSFLKKEATNVIYCKTQIEYTTTFIFIIKII
jgi:hypothetical protein